MEYQKKKGSYKFTDKKHPITAILMVVLAIVIAVTIGVLSYKSSLSAGNGSLIYGVISFFAMILSFVGFLVSVLSLKQKEIYVLFPILGAVLNGALFVGLFIVYIIGASI